jgi:hypothetical protein
VPASSNSLSPHLLILIFALVVAWMGVIFSLVSVFSGWHSLSKRFRAQSEPYGITKSAGPFFYSIYMRYWSHYGSAIRLTAADDALYLSVIFILRVGHPPLCIPWREIQFSGTRFFGRGYVVLTLGEQERIPMRISERMAQKLGVLERMDGGKAQTAI